MAKLPYLLLVLALSSIVSGQNSTTSASSSDSVSASSSASEAASSASDAASSASDAASASSLSSVGSSSEAASRSSVASSISSVASSLSSVASSASSVASETTSTSSSSSSSSSSSDTSTSTSTSESTSLVTSTSVAFSSSTIVSTDVLPVTSNGVISYSTITTYIVSSTPASTIVDVSPYTTEADPESSPTTQAGAAQSGGGGGGLSTGAKIGIGVGVGLAVVAAAVFGFWYSWFMRKRRRRSVSASDRYPPSSIPSMSGMMGGAAVGYADKSDTRSELPSPPIGGPIGGHHSPPPRSPDHLLPAAAGVRSWNSVTNSNVPPSSQSVSDYSERGGQPPPDPSDQPGPGYFAPPPTGPVHEIGGSQQPGASSHQAAVSPQQQFSHSRTVSGGSQPSELGDSGISPQTQGQHQRSFSGGRQQYQSPDLGSDGYWHDTHNAQELQGSPPQQHGEGYRGVDPEVPLHQRMQTERVPVRVGHLHKQMPGNQMGPSHNF